MFVLFCPVTPPTHTNVICSLDHQHSPGLYIVPADPHILFSSSPPQPQTPYNASKAGTFDLIIATTYPLSPSAVRHMASSLAVEWAKSNVRVNCLSPGYMATKLTKTILEHDPELKVCVSYAFHHGGAEFDVL